MTFKMLGMSDEERLAFEQASGIKTEGARLIYEASVEEAERLMQNAIREVQTVIGPHGSVTRLQAGGVRITPGAGIGVFTDGVAKTNIQNNGTLVIGSDITLPATTTEIFFTEDTIYNGEQFDAGDFLIGDNTTGQSNIKFDASEGQLQFRYGTTVQAYQDTDGTLRAGAGTVTLFNGGITLDNNAVGLSFKATDPLKTMYLKSNLSDALEIVNTVAGKAINLVIYLTDATAPYLEWKENPSLANGTLLNIATGAAGGRVAFGYDHYIDFMPVTPSGTKTVTFNERGADIDFVVEGDTDPNLFKCDAGEDAIYIKGLKITGAWTSFTPSWTNLTVGDGTNTGAYVQIGKTVHYRISFTFGSTSSISGGPVYVDFPVTSITYPTRHPLGTIILLDSGTAIIPAIAGWDTTARVLLFSSVVSGANIIGQSITTTTPFTWVTGDAIMISGTFEAG